VPSAPVPNTAWPWPRSCILNGRDSNPLVYYVALRTPS
jgi:hypothetical protein